MKDARLLWAYKIPGSDSFRREYAQSVNDYQNLRTVCAKGLRMFRLLKSVHRDVLLLQPDRHASQVFGLHV